ncbi:HAMP domain-containing sensor histidine kinase [Niallia taxi]|nr:HAMP domain-containing sensor histidine kinase [Niallia taxi]MDE5051176.1 HAMP domain-containing sensor histidine kinase [Niallia taxi]
MLRNRELRFYLLILSIIALLSTMFAYLYISAAAAIYVFVTCMVLICVQVISTWWRYREIAKLSGHLRRIANGDYQFDIRDNYEGELSILKSEIYKVTLMLSQQGSSLKKDKSKLTDAISDISHQLKTPLTSMMVMADLLSGKITEEKRQEFTRNIRIQLERIEWLVSSLLKLSKIDAGSVTFKKEKVPFIQVIEKAAEAVLIPMDIKQQSLKTEGDRNAVFYGDLKWTAEAILNILKNGIEHTAEGGEIYFSFFENALFTEISIRDTGKGIPKKDLPHIFKRFYKGENAGEDSVGIGLAMAYSIISAQNGDIEVVSKEGEGTTFQIKFYKQAINSIK